MTCNSNETVAERRKESSSGSAFIVYAWQVRAEAEAGNHNAQRWRAPSAPSGRPENPARSFCLTRRSARRRLVQVPAAGPRAEPSAFRKPLSAKELGKE